MKLISQAFLPIGLDVAASSPFFFPVRLFLPSGTPDKLLAFRQLLFLAQFCLALCATSGTSRFAVRDSDLMAHRADMMRL